MSHFDLIIVGAGISGIGAAVHFQRECPGKTFAILEGREAIGGTWDLFRYPGIRSDSDMHTLGYDFKPWREAKSIADGPSILKYLDETVEENDFREQIRFQHLVKSAAWSTDDACWHVKIQRAKEGDVVHLSCNFLFMCAGYYNYDKGFTPEFAGKEQFQGQIVEPQFWPEDLDYSGKKVIVIGSGATAMTLVPSMAKRGAQVTMVQRSPTYVVSRPDTDAFANALRKFLPEKVAYAITRFKNIRLQRFFFRRTRAKPELVKGKLLDMVREQLGAEYVEKHFTPKYNPWDERLCLIPNGDLFEQIKEGNASVITGEIDCFTEDGLKLKSGEELSADIIVTATGLELVMLSNVKFSVDGESVNFSDTYTYKGMLFSDVPNLVQSFGYVNASWTLRADLTCEYVCRLVNHMSKLGMRQCTPRLREEDAGMAARPWIVDFTPGYMKRVMHLFPKQGNKEPWLNTQNYLLDKKIIRHAPLEDGALTFSNPVGEKIEVSGEGINDAQSAVA